MPHIKFPRMLALTLTSLTFFLIIGFVSGWAMAFAAAAIGFFFRFCQRHFQDVKAKKIKACSPEDAPSEAETHTDNDPL